MRRITNEEAKALIEKVRDDYEYKDYPTAEQSIARFIFNNYDDYKEELDINYMYTTYTIKIDGVVYETGSSSYRKDYSMCEEEFDNIVYINDTTEYDVLLEEYENLSEQLRDNITKVEKYIANKNNSLISRYQLFINCIDNQADYIQKYNNDKFNLHASEQRGVVNIVGYLTEFMELSTDYQTENELEASLEKYKDFIEEILDKGYTSFELDW